MNAREIYTQGQQIKTLRILDDGSEIIKTRTIEKVGSGSIKMKGLAGWYVLYTTNYKTTGNQIHLNQNNRYLTILS